MHIDDIEYEVFVSNVRKLFARLIHVVDSSMLHPLACKTAVVALLLEYCDDSEEEEFDELLHRIKLTSNKKKDDC